MFKYFACLYKNFGREFPFVKIFSKNINFFTESFGMVCQVHDVETRHRTLSVSLPSTGRNRSEAFKLNGIKSWNKLPLKIKKLNSAAYFKQAVRLYLIDRRVSEYNSDFLYH